MVVSLSLLAGAIMLLTNNDLPLIKRAKQIYIKCKERRRNRHKWKTRKYHRMWRADHDNLSDQEVKSNSDIFQNYFYTGKMSYWVLNWVCCSFRFIYLSVIACEWRFWISRAKKVKVTQIKENCWHQPKLLSWIKMPWNIDAIIIIVVRYVKVFFKIASNIFVNNYIYIYC